MQLYLQLPEHLTGKNQQQLEGLAFEALVVRLYALGELSSGEGAKLLHAPALLAFERENRAYFAAAVPDRGDEFFAEFDTQYAQLLESQAAGTDYFHLLVTERGEVVGRVNLFKVADGAAELGYRIAQKAAGQGLATAAVGKVRELAASKYELSRLYARVTLDNPASRKVLERNGFVAVGELTLNGKPARSYICELR